MWWDHQNLDKSRFDKSGKRWNFRVWHGLAGEEYIERIFYWDNEKMTTGIVEISPSVHISRIRNLISKLVVDPGFRIKHGCELRFPLDRHYSEYESLE